MKAASLHEVKKELNNLAPDQVMELCLRLAKYKKENKELLSYLLFDAHDEDAFIKGVKEEMVELFADIHNSNLYYAKKNLRKILKAVNKHIKHSGNVTTEIELLLFYCNKIKEANIAIQRYPVLLNLYNNQVKKIQKAISKLHEDLQYDYQGEVEKILY